MKEAAENTRNYLDTSKKQSYGILDDALGQSTGYINRGYGSARDALKTGYDTSTGAVTSGASGALGYLDQGTRDALGRLDSARSAYTPLSGLGSKYGGATTLALNALGVNGADAANTARSSFSASPAYDFNLDQGLEAINRRRAAGGMLASGNADRDAQTYGAGLASQEYDKWLNNLLGFTSPELAATSGAASGMAGVDTNAANLVNTSGINKANVESQKGAMLADLASRYGSNVAGNYTGEGTTLANLTTGAAGAKVGVNNAMLAPYSNSYSQEGAAEMAGSGNLWNFALNAGKAAAGFI